MNIAEDFETRLFRKTDLDQVIKINFSCLPENYTQFFFLELYYRFPKSFIVATVDEVVVGYIMCRIERGFSEMRKFKLIGKAHIVSIAVLPEYRRKGVGNALVTKALEGMKEYNVNECYLEVRVSNLSAINLYKKFEFEIVRKIGGYYKDFEDAYVMAKEIQ